MYLSFGNANQKSAVRLLLNNLISTFSLFGWINSNIKRPGDEGNARTSSKTFYPKGICYGLHVFSPKRKTKIVCAKNLMPGTTVLRVWA